MSAQPAADPASIAALADFAELADVLVVLEDFLLHAGADLAEDLAGYAPGRLDDPQAWVSWVADRLGEHAATLRRLDAAATAPPVHIPTGEPS